MAAYFVTCASSGMIVLAYAYRTKKSALKSFNELEKEGENPDFFNEDEINLLSYEGDGSYRFSKKSDLDAIFPPKTVEIEAYHG